MMEDLNDLYYFAAVVEHGGFAPAGRALGIPKSKLSRRVALIEDRLGVHLIHRTTRQFVVTDIGQSFYQHCQAMVVDAEAAIDTIGQSRAEPRGLLRVACPVSLVQIKVGAIAGEFLARHPLVTMHLEATDRRVDVIEERFDVALRVRQPPLEDSNLVIRKLGEGGLVLVASPEFLQRHGWPERPEQLADWPSASLPSRTPEHSWALSDDKGQLQSVAHKPRLISSEMFTLRQAAMQGIGAAQLPYALVENEIRQGFLEVVLPAWKSPQGITHAVFATRRGLLPAVRTFIDFLAQAFKNDPMR
jgi:DNA-binding transcriptional LysR family regulator